MLALGVAYIFTDFIVRLRTTVTLRAKINNTVKRLLTLTSENLKILSTDIYNVKRALEKLK